MPSETFPELATRNRSAATALSREVTAIPPALRGAQILEAILRSTSCNVVKAGLFQSTNSSFTNGNCAIDCLIVTQLQGSQTNSFCKCGFRITQLEEERGLKLPIWRVVIDTPRCVSSAVIRCRTVSPRA